MSHQIQICSLIWLNHFKHYLVVINALLPVALIQIFLLSMQPEMSKSPPGIVYLPDPDSNSQIQNHNRGLIHGASLHSSVQHFPGFTGGTCVCYVTALTSLVGLCKAHKKLTTMAISNVQLFHSWHTNNFSSYWKCIQPCFLIHKRQFTWSAALQRVVHRLQGKV